MNENNIDFMYTLSNKSNMSNSTIAIFNDTLLRIEMNHFIRQVNYWLMIAEFIMFICGVLGNGLALIVINRPSLRDTSSSVFITYLAIFDTSVLFVHVTSLVVLRRFRSYIIHCFLTYLTDLVTFCSIWIMVIMTIERCIAVHSPFLTKRFCTIKRARYSIYILLCLAFIFFTFTFPFVYTINNRIKKCSVRVQYHTLIRIIKPIMFYLVPDIILLINLFIIYELFIAKRQRKLTLVNPENAVHHINAGLYNRKQQQLTIMLVTVSLSFYLFTTPAIIDYVHQRNPPKYRDIKRLKRRFLATNLTVLWLQMSSATNFLFYCLAGSKFRATCIETFSDIYDYIRMKFDDNYQRRRSSSGAYTSSNYGLEMRNGLQYDYRDKSRSGSTQQTYTCRLSNSSKRLSNDTVIGSLIR